MQPRLLYLLLLFIPVNAVRAQQTIETQYQFWARYNPHIRLTENLKVKADVDERIFVLPVRQHQYIVRAQLDRALTGNWHLSAGGAFFQQHLPQDPDLPVASTTPELRPELETNLKNPITNNLQLQHRFRSDFRFFRTDDQSGFSYSHTRFRYMLGFRYALGEQWTLTVFDEILLNGLKNKTVNTFDQNRIGMNVTRRINEALSVDLMYFNWYQLRSTPDSYYNRHIIRATLVHKFSLH